jgi:hypothetical protein
MLHGYITMLVNKTLKMWYAFFWVIPRRPNFICRRFGTLYSIFIGEYLSVYEDGTECSEMFAYKIQTPGNYAE